MSPAMRRAAMPALFVVALAAAVRLAWLLLVPNEQWSDVRWYAEAARHLARTGTLEFPAPDGPYRAWFPPGWPATLAVVFLAFGDGDWIVKTLNLVLAAALVFWTVDLGTRVLGRTAGIAGGLFLALLPGHVMYVSLAQYEVFLTALLVFILFMVARTHWNRVDARHPVVHVIGALLAVAVLTRPVLLFMPVLLGLTLRSRARAWRRLTIVLACWVAVVSAAWTVRNAIVLGEPVLYSTHASYNFWLGNREGATGGVPALPNEDPRNIRSLKDELAIHREGYRRAFAFIVSNPAQFVALVPRRVTAMYATDTTGLYMAFLRSPMTRPGLLDRWRHGSPLPERVTFRAYVVVMLLAVVGIVLAPWASADVRLWIGVIVGVTAVSAVSFGTDRFHVPLMPLFCLFAGRAVERAVTSVRRLSANAGAAGTGRGDRRAALPS